MERKIVLEEKKEKKERKSEKEQEKEVKVMRNFDDDSWNCPICNYKHDALATGCKLCDIVPGQLIIDSPRIVRKSLLSSSSFRSLETSYYKIVSPNFQSDYSNMVKDIRKMSHREVMEELFK
jgi:uncharacterized protein (DUF2225 family)